MMNVITIKGNVEQTFKHWIKVLGLFFIYGGIS